MRDFLIVNPGAPVTAYVRGDEGGKTRKFKNWGEFRNWYDEKVHGYMNLPPNSREEFTDVLVDTLEDSQRKRRAPGAGDRIAGAKPAKAGSSGKGTRIKVDGKEHLGFERVFMAVGWEFPSPKCRAFRKEIKEKKKLTIDGKTFELMEDGK